MQTRNQELETEELEVTDNWVNSKVNHFESILKLTHLSHHALYLLEVLPHLFCSVEVKTICHLRWLDFSVVFNAFLDSSKSLGYSESDINCSMIISSILYRLTNKSLNFLEFFSFEIWDRSLIWFIYELQKSNRFSITLMTKNRSNHERMHFACWT